MAHRHKQHQRGSIENLCPRDMQVFEEVIKKGWNTNVEAGASAVLSPSESQIIRQRQPNRIMQSRLLHVAKPIDIDDLSQFDDSKIEGEAGKAKSRWIGRGDKHPDVLTSPSS